MAREDRATWAKRVQRWTESGLTAREFAAELGVNVRTLSYWKWRLQAESGGESRTSTRARRRRSTTGSIRRSTSPTQSPLAFIELTQPTAEGTSTKCIDPYELVLATGIRIRIPATFDAQSLSRLLDVLGAAR